MMPLAPEQSGPTKAGPLDALQPFQPAHTHLGSVSRILVVGDGA